jgi:RNA polymerase sigma-70 factor (ECF subfamily)
VRHLELVEDAVQDALMSALTSWMEHEVPDDPSAWLYRVAWNGLIQDLRLSSRRQRLLDRAGEGLRDEGNQVNAFSPDEVRSDMLRMLFVCCDEAIPWESRLVLALKTLCGFSTAEIALRLFTSEANVHKRLGRARDRLRRSPPDIEGLPLQALGARLPSVHSVIYLIFNEGYLSANVERAIRRELCEEAVELATLLVEHPVGAVPESFALLALLHLQMARLGSRIDDTGGLLLLEEQDRSLWDRDRIRVGVEWLQRSADGEVFSRLHAEAGIAAEHCLAPTFHETRWDEIARLYAMLERIAPSPLHTVNRAVAVAEYEGPQAGLAVLNALAPPAWLSDSYHWNAVMSDLHLRIGNIEIARRHRGRALESAPSPAVRELLRRRLRSAAPPGEQTAPE